MQTLAGLCHFDFNQAASNSYEQVFSVMNRLELCYPEKLNFFKRMIFNVMVCNCDDHVKNVSFFGGCNGNLKGIAALVEGKKAEEVIPVIKGIKCGFKSTSCPDQLAIALEKYKQQANI